MTRHPFSNAHRCTLKAHNSSAQISHRPSQGGGISEDRAENCYTSQLGSDGNMLSYKLSYFHHANTRHAS